MSQFISSKILNKIGQEKYELLKIEYSSDNKIKLYELKPYNPNKVEFICNNCNKSYSTNIQTWIEKKNEFGKCSHKKISSVYEENKILDIWDYSKNIISPKDVTSGSSKKAYFICKKCNSSLFISISQMSKAFEKNLNGCKYCSGNSVNETNSFATKYFEFSKNIISPDPNNYTFSSHIKCLVKCKTCNNEYNSSFNILSKSIKAGNNGCSYCSGLKISRNTSIGSKFPDIAKNIIGDPFELSIKDKFMFKCFSCNYIHETDIKHIKQTCRYCTRISVNENNNITKTHPEILKYWDYEKNKIKPENHLYGSGNKVFIRCKECFSSRKKFTYDIKDNLCRYCAMNSVSKVEKEWLDSLSIPIECRQIILKINNKTIYVDALYNNTIYEFNGDFWHGNPNKYNPNEINKVSKKTFGELYNKTLEKEKFLKENGYNIISIWESDFKLKDNIHI